MEDKGKNPKKTEIKGIIRILETDIDGNKKIYTGLRKIKGISFGISNAICNHLKIDKNTKVGTLSSEKIQQIENLIKNPKELPKWLLNRRKDIETGKNIHLTSSKLGLRVDSDIKRMKKSKDYKGMRHAWGLPTRGQRTRGHFRRGGKVGVVKKKLDKKKDSKGKSKK